MKKRRNSHYLMMFYLIAGLLLPGGCKKEEQPPSPPQAKLAPAVKVLPPVQKQPSSAKIGENLKPSMEFSSRKDPFKPFVAPQAQVAKPGASAGRTGSKELLPIQSYELSKFKVAGIIVGLKENSALVIDPAGKGYVVKKGTLIGSDDGHISRITATTIEVVESYKDDNGRIRKRTSKLILPQKK
jgi:type IV pilus assembly protein PilP